MPRIKKTISFDTTAGTVSESALDIPIPDGQAIEVTSCRVVSERSANGTVNHNGLFACLAAEATALTDVDTTSIPDERALIGSVPIHERASNSGCQTLAEAFMTLEDEPFALDLRVIVGQPATVATGPTVETMFDISYEFKRITTAVGVALAAK